MSRHTFTIFTGHQMTVERLESAPAEASLLPFSDYYDTWWIVKDSMGRTWYAAKGHSLGKNQIVVWYPNLRMWSSFAKTVMGAIEGAVKDAWLYL